MKRLMVIHKEMLNDNVLCKFKHNKKRYLLDILNGYTGSSKNMILRCRLYQPLTTPIILFLFSFHKNRNKCSSGKHNCSLDHLISAVIT